MATKHDDRCLQKVSDDEPIFVLRAQDRLAPALVREWVRQMSMHAALNNLNADEIQARAKEALELADRMEQWPTRKYPD
jgi:hypothetical protein